MEFLSDSTKKVLDNLPEKIFVKDINLNYVFVNKAYKEELKIPISEIIGKSDFDLFSETTAKSYIRKDREVLRIRRSVKFLKEYEIENKRALLRILKLPIFEEGEVVGILGIATNLNELKETKDSLVDLKEKLTIATELSNVGVWEIDLKTQISQWSDAFYKILGLEPWEMSAENILNWDFIHPEDRVATEEVIRNAFETGTPFRIKKRIIQKNGNIKTVVSKGKVIFDELGNAVKFSGVFWDVTEFENQKKQIYELTKNLKKQVDLQTEELAQIVKEKEVLLEHYQNFVTTFGEMVYEYNILDDCFSWDGDSLKTIGYAERDLGKTLQSWREKLFIQDVIKSNELYEKIKIGLINQFELEYRIVTKEKKIMWIRNQGVVKYNEHKEAISVMGVIKNIHSRKKAELELEKLATRDALTNVYNRHGFFELLENELGEAKKEDLALIMYFADLDGLKAINDTYGHHVGDRMLRTFADILNQNLRRSDIVARLGGDEFVFCSKNLSKQQPEDIIHRINEALENYNAESTNAKFKLAVSIGYAVYNSTRHKNLEQFIHEADKAMYKVKTQRKNL